MITRGPRVHKQTELPSVEFLWAPSCPVVPSGGRMLSGKEIAHEDSRFHIQARLMAAKTGAFLSASHMTSRIPDGGSHLEALQHQD